MTEELKPCPFCGCKKTNTERYNEDYSINYYDEDVVCNNCGCRMHISQWNRRTPEPNTIILRWTRYDGTEETLPEKMHDVLVQKVAFNNPVIDRFTGKYEGKNMWSGSDEYLFHIGDLWAYLPTLEIVSES